MADLKFKTVLENLLKTDKRLVDENKELNLTLVRELVDKLDEKLISLLLSNKEAKAKFFLKIKDVFVFRHNDFKFFLDENKIDNSYTAYENRIGLSAGGKFLKEIDDVVLDFPYKDCLLEGGQTTEEGIDEYYEYDEEAEKYKLKESPRKEIFFNEILAADEIDRLEEPKAFTNIKKYTSKGVEKLKKFTRDKDGILTDNLVIKGNNLLALQSLKASLNGKIRLIYIDPPFAKDSDTFYNDNFKRSTWLTFMRNRLEVAWDLLSEKGLLFVHIDDKHQHYLRVLCDEVLGEENIVNVIILKSGRDEGVKMTHKEKKLVKFKEYIIFYSKGPVKLIPQYKEKFVWDDRYNYWLEKYNSSDPENWGIINLSEKLNELGLAIADEEEILEWKISNASDIIRLAANNSKEIKKTKGKKKILKFTSPKGLPVFAYNGQKILFASNKIKEIKGATKLGEYIGDIWDDIPYNNLHNEGGVDLPNGKKPEALLERIMRMCIWPNEKPIILDYHLGCGTTAAVAHKLGYQYIGIEQLDYGKNDSVVRLKNVINGENVGLSIDWQGGGSFIYLELKKWNEEAKGKIYSCKTLKELKTLFKELCDKYFLHYNVRVRDFIEGDKDKKIHPIVDEDNFKKLPLKKQQEMFAKMLDLNQMYVNASEMEDKKFGLSKEDIALTKDFYQM